jgi:hypothetical protein
MCFHLGDWIGDDVGPNIAEAVFQFDFTPRETTFQLYLPGRPLAVLCVLPVP